ncbi:hypothetical protein JTB14_013265 [Gonioctena quinquepunctata]|nr:hypothetical protein JTB14_013265 [Gonioctena quinquepunctata]
MGGTVAQRQLKMLTAKKESLFSILQNLLDLSKSMRNQTEKSRFSALYKSTDSTKADLIKVIDQIMEVNYLVGRLKGSALGVCTGVAPTGGNYNIIWKALVDKYRDARSVATSYLDQILGFKHIQGESAKNLESFLEKFDCAVQALKNLKLQDLADFILMHQALAKLDSETVKSFEMSVRGRPLTGVQHEQVHRTIPSEGSSTSEVVNTNTSTSETTNNNFHATAMKNRNNTVLLSTVVVNVLNGSGQGQKARFLLDSGSQVHLITHKCSKKLGLKISRCFSSVQGIGSNSNSVKGITDLIVASRYDSSKKYFMQAFLVDKISDKLPRLKIDRSFLSSFGNVQLADDKFDEPTEIDGIIGAELFATVMGNNSYASSTDHQWRYRRFSEEESSLNELMRKFWEIEQVPKNTSPNTEELECEKMYTSTFNRDSVGRFTVALPIKNSPNTLGDSKECAMTRLFSLERKLTKFSELRSGYNDIMRESIEQGHMHWRLLWRFSPDEPVQVYEFNRLAFGVKTSPYLALRTVKQLIKEEVYKYPFAAEVVSTDIYMDDLVCSVPSEEEAHRLYLESVAMFAEGKFDLTKWSSSSLHLLEKIPFDRRLSQPVLFKTETKILGMIWNPEIDSFRFRFPVPGSSCTKRIILSTVARCYDPIGLVAPFILYLKLLIKELWKLKIGWDEMVPNEIFQKWSKLKDEWSAFEKIQFSRYMGIVRTSPVMLVAFADASMDGYGAVVYVRTVTENGEITVNLLCAKSKVSPFKVVTVPRLELVAALLLSQLVKHVSEIFNNKDCISKIFAFSDSTTVLQWLNASFLKDIFVANRVSQIKENISNAEWGHISGVTNPADILSRGATPFQLMENYFWASGPTWMRLPVADWPIREQRFFDESGEEVDSIKCLVSTEETETHPLYDMVMRLSSYTTILRVTVWVLRFVKILTVKSFITLSDMNRAEVALVRIVQGKYFKSDIKLLNLGKEISNRLRKLNPFLQNGILMVGGEVRECAPYFRGSSSYNTACTEPNFENLAKVIDRDWPEKVYKVAKVRHAKVYQGDPQEDLVVFVDPK